MSDIKSENENREERLIGETDKGNREQEYCYMDASGLGLSGYRTW